MFTILFFGPIDIFLSNQQFFNVSWDIFLLPFTLICLGGLAIVSALAALLRGKVYNFAVAYIFAIALCSYI